VLARAINGLLAKAGLGLASAAATGLT